MPAEYYSKILYPLQDKVFPAVIDSPFYLTGGTALSRGYYNHRYSDDLDYFVNDHSDFHRISEKQIEKL
ncbi:MAG: nucleotidyl transferase AbiEii/AbiGii toxin family protein, partial [Nitrospirae bacterium]|nr:nucleotidyl transferase AbiEii/AbiGii toxin family protein [Nitrospirota bacterium]